MSNVPPSLARAGLSRIETNLQPGQKVVLPKGLIVTFFKKELQEALTKHAQAQQAQQPPEPVQPKRRYLREPEGCE